LILTAGLTPSWQQTLLFESFRTGQVNRAREMRWHAAGKTVNVGIALHHLGASSLTLFCAGGVVGQSIVRDLNALGIPHRCVWTESESRVCTTIIDRAGDQITELVANAPSVSPADLRAFQNAFAEIVPTADLLVLSGSLPAGTPVTFYRDLIASASCPVILDASGPELLAALEAKPMCVKPNREELARTLRLTLDSEDKLRSAMRELQARGAGSVIVSQGALPVAAHLGDRFYEFIPPKIETLNPIGSGDCLAAGLASGLADGLSMLDAIRLGIAAGAENAESLISARLDRNRVRALLSRVTARMAGYQDPLDQTDKA
jgi:tagatose 6-phosphate kinase